MLTHYLNFRSGRDQVTIVDTTSLGPDNRIMSTGIGKGDLRLLSLLHALGKNDEWFREAVRVLLESGVDESAWARIRQVGFEIAPKQRLFNSSMTLEQLGREFAGFPKEEDRGIRFDRRRGERRIGQRRNRLDRRSDERRTSILPWPGKERRAGERRQFMYCQT